MPVADRHADGRTYGRDRIYRTPVGSAGGPKIRIYKKVIEEVSKEYEGAREFTSNKITELCSEEGLSTEEVCLCIFFNKKT